MSTLEDTTRRTVRLLMKETGVRLVDAAELLGLSEAAVSRKLSGKGGTLGINDLVCFAELLGMSPADLLGENGRRRPRTRASLKRIAA